jgi:hypothetical protein
MCVRDHTNVVYYFRDIRLAAGRTQAAGCELTAPVVGLKGLRSFYKVQICRPVIKEHSLQHLDAHAWPTEVDRQFEFCYLSGQRLNDG